MCEVVVALGAILSAFVISVILSQFSVMSFQPWVSVFIIDIMLCDVFSTLLQHGSLWLIDLIPNYLISPSFRMKLTKLNALI